MAVMEPLEFQIDAPFYLEVSLPEEEYPGHFAEYRLHKLIQELVTFVYRVADGGAQTLAEESYIRAQVAMKLTEPFLLNEPMTRMLAERLTGRLAQRTERSGPNGDVAGSNPAAATNPGA